MRGGGWVVLMYAWMGFIAFFGATNLFVVPAVSDQHFPRALNRDALVFALHPQWVGVCFLICSLLVAAVVWRTGRKQFPDRQEDALLFMSVASWAFVFAGIGIVGLGVSMIPEIGLKVARYQFTSTCEREDELGSREGCECLAATLEAQTPALTYVPFYANAVSLWQSRKSYAGYDMRRYLEAYEASMSKAARDSFGRALAEGMACMRELHATSAASGRDVQALWREPVTARCG